MKQQNQQNQQIQQKKIIIASGNQGKLREFQKIFSAADIEILPQSEFDVPDVEETGLSFVENAILKARHACKHTGLPAIADDSGLAVDALHGAPGIYSARYAGSPSDDKRNNAKLLQDLSAIPANKRSARFICVLAYLEHQNDPLPLIAQGIWEGNILFSEQGENGFGYDPLFYIEEKQCSSAELAPEEKNHISHRAKALKCFIDAWK